LRPADPEAAVGTPRYLFPTAVTMGAPDYPLVEVTKIRDVLDQSLDGRVSEQALERLEALPELSMSFSRNSWYKFNTKFLKSQIDSLCRNDTIQECDLLF